MGRTASKIFGEVETYDDLKEAIFQGLTNYPHVLYMDDTSLQTAITGLQSPDEKTQKQLLKFARCVDRKLSSPGTARGNAYHKLPAVLAGSIYLIYYPDKVKDLTPDELILLSRYATFEPPELYEQTADYFGKDLLGAITTKHFDYMFQWTFLMYAESKLKQGKPKEDVAAYINEIPIEQLKEEAFEHARQSFEEMGKYL